VLETFPSIAQSNTLLSPLFSYGRDYKIPLLDYESAEEESTCNDYMDIHCPLKESPFSDYSAKKKKTNIHTLYLRHKKHTSNCSFKYEFAHILES
jgi:hypothetical protein